MHREERRQNTQKDNKTIEKVTIATDKNVRYKNGRAKCKEYQKRRIDKNSVNSKQAAVTKNNKGKPKQRVNNSTSLISDTSSV